MWTRGLLIALLGLGLGLAAGPGCKKKSEGTTPPPPGFDESDVAGAGAQEGAESEENVPPPPEKLEQVQQVFRMGRLDLEHCFNELVNRKKTSDLKGFVILSVKIGVTEEPSEVRIFKISPQLEDEEFKRCIIRAAKQWDFPTWGHPFEITSPKYTFLGT